MKNIIKNIIDLWDPYKIYVFPEDEYRDYSEKIFDYIKMKTKIEAKELTTFTYNIMPPIEKSNYEFINLVEYERFAKTIISIINKNNKM